MKRKILSLLLVLMFIPTAFLFSACKDKGYNLNNLQKDLMQLKLKQRILEKMEQNLFLIIQIMKI